jgi:hypothetical protein
MWAPGVNGRGLEGKLQKNRRPDPGKMDGAGTVIASLFQNNSKWEKYY